MEKQSDLDPVEVFAGTSWEAGMLISLLADNEIAAYYKDENFGSVMPWLLDQSGSAAIKVVVAAQDYAKASGIVDEFRKTLN